MLQQGRSLGLEYPNPASNTIALSGDRSANLAPFERAEFQFAARITELLRDYYSPASGQYALVRFEISGRKSFRSIHLDPVSAHSSHYDRIESAVMKLARKEPEIQNSSWREIRTYDQQFNGDSLSKHLLPHFIEGAVRSGLTLADYASRLETDPSFFKNQKEWLLLPFETVYGMSREGTGAVSGDWSNTFVEFLGNGTQSLAWALPEVVKLIKTKSEALIPLLTHLVCLHLS